MSGELIARDFQFQLGGALLLGDSTDYDIVRIVGLDDLPDVRTTDKEKALRHGLYPSADFYGKRVIVIELEVWADTPTEMRAAIDVLDAATSVPDADSDFVGRLTGYSIGDFLISVRPRKRDLPLDQEMMLGKANATIQLEASDPRIYSNLLQSASTAVVTAAGGLSLPLTLPLDLGGTGDSGTFSAANLGNFEAPWVATINGPITDPQIQNVTTGELVRVAGSLSATDVLTIDQDNRRILLNGTQSRYSGLTSDSSLTWGLAPGTTSLRFSGTTSGSPQLTMSWRHTKL